MKLDALPAGHAPPARDVRDNAQVAGKQLEAFFLRQLLAESRPKGGGMLDGGFAGDTFKQMLDEAIADKMTAAGGIGLTAMFAKQLGRVDESAGAPGAPTPQVPGVEDSASPDGTTRFSLPVVGRPTSGYGMRTDPVHGNRVNHAGFDLAAATGTQVSAAAPGTVVHAGPAGTYGNLVTLRHDDGFETRYAHLSAIDVKVGDLVEAGQDLGKVGTTGHSTGPHLHFEVHHGGKAIDPAPLLPLHSSSLRTTR